MEKFHSLLNETTFINIKLMFQLIARYKALLLIALASFTGIFAFNYYSQPVIYAIDLPIKHVSSQKVSTDLSSLLPVDNASGVSFEELNINLSNYTFLKSLSILMLKQPNFKSLNFGSTKSTKSLTGLDITKSCSGNNDCVTERLIQPLRELYVLEQGPTENRFKISINSIQENATRALASVLAKAVEIDRIKVRQYSVLKEIKNVENLIAESRSIMISMGGQKSLEEQEKLQNNINDLKDRIKLLQNNISIEKSNGTTLQARLLENKKTTKSVGETRANYESYQKAQVRLNNIKIDLTNLSNIPDDKRSVSDKLIIAQLIAERSQLLKIIPAEHMIKSMELNESFKEKQRQNSDNFEFDYLVSKNKILKLQEDYEASKVELNSLMQKNLINESKISGMRGDLEFLKGLEAKHMSLRLMNATMTSDLIFEGIGSQVDEFRKSSVFKIVLFSLFSTLLVYFFILLILYSADDKIYGEDDIRMYFKDLDFVGEVPSFE